MSQEFVWATSFKKTWNNQTNTQTKHHNKSTTTKNAFKKGIIKHLQLIIDYSEYIESIDYLPNIRHNFMLLADKFSKSFSETNPLSLLSILTIRNEKVHNFCYFDKFIKLSEIFKLHGNGRFSLGSALEFINEMDKTNYLKEILVIVADIGTRDVINLSEKIEIMKQKSIKISFISLNGEITLYKRIAMATGGMFCVASNLYHFEQLLFKYCIPTVVNSSAPVNLLKLAFPERIVEQSICSCHLKLTNFGYICPICNTKVCQLPLKCPICEINLVNMMNLNKNMYYCYPMKQMEDAEGICKICNSKASKKCSKCSTFLCENCSYKMEGLLDFCIFCD